MGKRSGFGQMIGEYLTGQQRPQSQPQQPQQPKPTYQGYVDAGAYDAAPERSGWGKSSRQRYAGDTNDYYAGLEDYAAGGGDMSGVTGPSSGGEKYDARYLGSRQENYDKAIEARDYVNRGGEGTQTLGGITRGYDMPEGGIVAPADVYTGHTGTEGTGAKSKGTGGGERIKMAPPSQREQILARPDLAAGKTQAPQFATQAPQGKVNSIANQMAQAKALRSGGE
jgi:hypothetical protein